MSHVTIFRIQQNGSEMKYPISLDNSFMIIQKLWRYDQDLPIMELKIVDVPVILPHVKPLYWNYG